MKISYNWLKDYIATNLSPDDISALLTSTGLEVEGTSVFGTVEGGLEGCVIGEVKTCAKHPGADKLSLTTVDIGEPELLHIVCGAPNVKAGQKVVVATVGTTLHKGEEKLTLKEVNIRGELSQGMICAEDELGLGDSHEGILVLDREARIGTPAREYFGIYEDTVFEIGITPNRIDGASHYGVARDLAASLMLNMAIKLEMPDMGRFSQDDDSLHIEVIIENSIACRRYSGLSITGLNVMESPVWLKNRLKAIGLNPINNIVDVTNYVLYELGQPLHAFDADKITGKRVVVKTMPEGTSFTTLDGVNRILSSDDLMICNAETGMCIAGVFGGTDSGVTLQTKNIFLESAWFNPTFVRRTAHKHGLNTDASFRFERGADPEMTVPALKRAAILIREIAGGKVSSPVIDVYPQPFQPVLVTTRFASIKKLIGKEIDRITIKKILNALQISIVEEDDIKMILSVPPFRVDVTREPDIIEEILRIYGYNNIEIDEHLSSVLTYSEKPDPEKLTGIISNYLTDNGFNEIMSNSLTKESYYKDKPEAISISNPLSADLSKLRTTLLFGGLEAISYNTNRQRTNIKFYEFGNCYFYKPPSKGKDPLARYHEETHLALFLSGNRSDGNWLEKDTPSTFYQLKSFTENVLQRLAISPTDLEMSDFSNDYLEEGIRLSDHGRVICEFGAIKHDLIRQLDLKNPVYYSDVNWSAILNNLSERKITFMELPRFPEVTRDISMVLEKNIKFEDIRKLAFETENHLLKRIVLFDVYEGQKIDTGKKSYAISLILQDENKTLTDNQIDTIITRLSEAFEKKLGARIRK